MYHNMIDRGTKFMLNIQSVFSTLSQCLEDYILESSLRRWADTAATYCPGRPSQIVLKSITKHHDGVEKTLCTHLILLFMQVRDGVVEFVADLLEVLQLFRFLQTGVVVRLSQDFLVERLQSRRQCKITIS